MASRLVSDLTGKLVDEDGQIVIVIKQHPELSAPVRLDANISELAGLHGVQELVALQVTDKNGKTTEFAVSLDEFEGMFAGDVMEVLKNAPPAVQVKAGGGKRDPAALEQIRTWARANGWPDLSSKGRIPAEIEAAYTARAA